MTPETPLIFRPFEWLLLDRPWSRGRVVLIGDAAHATTAHMGYGGGLAIEDGVAVAEEILSAETVAKAFASFEARRYERVRHVVETSLSLSRLEQKGSSEAELEAVLAPALMKMRAAF